MDILFSSAFLLLILFLVSQFLDSKHYKTLIKLAVLGIIVGLIAIFYVSFFASSIKIVSPIEINTENATSENLKIYAITFSKDATDTINRNVVFDKELAPATNSSFSIDKDNLGKFWIVAKNDANEIKYLQVADDSRNQIDITITEGQNNIQADAQVAREMIFALDINKQVLTFAIWSNVLLIVLLLWSIIKLKKNRQ